MKKLDPHERDIYYTKTNADTVEKPLLKYINIAAYQSLNIIIVEFRNVCYKKYCQIIFTCIIIAVGTDDVKHFETLKTDNF